MLTDKGRIHDDKFTLKEAETHLSVLKMGTRIKIKVMCF